MMLCEKCHKREANVKFTQVIGKEKKTLNLCKVCAEKQGLNNPLMDISKVFGKIIVAILSEHHLTSKTSKDKREVGKEIVCNNCGLRWEDFKASGRLGCAQCYDTYMEELKTLLRRLHGNNRHIGKNSPPDSVEKKKSLTLLKKKLKKAVEREEYELAAELRDHIRELEREGQITSKLCQTS